MVSLLNSSTLLILVCLISVAGLPWEEWKETFKDALLNLFEKDGVGTKILEVLPGGGYVTAIFHLKAGNYVYMLQAALAGFGTVTGLVVGGPPGAIAVGVAISIAAASSFIAQNEKHFRAKRAVTRWYKLTPEELAGLAIGQITHEEVFRLFTESHLSAGRGFVAAYHHAAGDKTKAGRILLEEMNEKIERSAKKSSAQAGGQKQLKSCHGTYLHANEENWTVSMKSGHAGELEQWYIEDWRGKVVFKARGDTDKPGQFISAYPDGSVNLIPDHPHDAPTTFFKPLKNMNGSWSFLSPYGTFLSARADGSVTTVEQCREWEQFWLETWTE